MTAHSLDELFWHMRWLAEKAPSDWERQFASDMAKRGHWKHWKPSKKQITTMRRLVHDAFGNSTVEVIER